MILVKNADLQEVATPGGNSLVGLATPGRGATETSVIRQRQAPGGANPFHRHDREEVLILQSGSIAVVVDHDRQVLNAGDTAIIPAETVHRIENVGVTPAEWLIVAPIARRFFGPDGEEAHPEWAL